MFLFGFQKNLRLYILLVLHNDSSILITKIIILIIIFN